MSLVFRGKFIDYLKDAYNLGEIEFPGRTKAWGTKSGFRKFIEKLWSKSGLSMQRSHSGDLSRFSNTSGDILIVLQYPITVFFHLWTAG